MREGVVCGRCVVRKVGACGHAPIMFYLGEVPRRAGSKEGQVDGGGARICTLLR